MFKKRVHIFTIALFFLAFLPVQICFGADYGKKLSKEERSSICQNLAAAEKKKATDAPKSNNDIVPDSVFANIYKTTQDISNSVSAISILGDALMCHASHAAKEDIHILGIKIGSHPDFTVWLCGMLIYFYGFMLLLSITFYVVDISFKLGLAVILLPIGVALWPFAWTRDKLSKLISIILKSAAIFVFLALTVSYTLNMVNTTLGNMDEVFNAIDTSNTDLISQTFTLFSTHFLIVCAAFIYGMKLIGATVPDYVDKFFPDGVFGGGKASSPIHHAATQSLDFAKKKIVAPAASFAHDVARTQTGKAMVKAGRFIQSPDGLKRAIHNPTETAGVVAGKVADKGLGLISGVGKIGNHLKYGAQIAGANLLAGKENRQALKNDLRQKRQAADDKIENSVHKPMRDSIEGFQKSIDDHEKDLAAEKQRKYANRIATDPKYQARIEKRKLRYAKIGALERQIEDIEKDRQSKKGIATNVSAGFKKAVKKVQKGWYQIPDALGNAGKGVLKAPGSIMEQVGTQMQKNKHRSSFLSDYAQEKSREEEERENRKRRSEDWTDE